MSRELWIAGAVLADRKGFLPAQVVVDNNCGVVFAVRCGDLTARDEKSNRPAAAGRLKL